MPKSDREIVLELFERHRATPGAPYDEARFISYLMADPKKSLHDSFRGLRRYNRFLEDVQLHYGICFSLKDFEADYPLQKFLDRIEKLKRSRRGSIASFRNQERGGFGWQVVVVGNILCLFVLVPTYAFSFAAGSVVAAFTLAANVAMILFYYRWRAYRKRLLASIQNSE